MLRLLPCVKLIHICICIQVPKKDFYCHPIVRHSVHEELLTLAREGNKSVAVIAEEINKQLLRHQHSPSASGAAVDSMTTVIVVGRKSSMHLIGQLLNITESFISDSQAASGRHNSDLPLVDLWREAGHSYTNEEAARIRQVLVILDDAVAVAMGDSEYRACDGYAGYRNRDSSKVYSFPGRNMSIRINLLG